MPRCFVIQPFDNGPYDKRYRDVLKPAIIDAGLEPYRVDEDAGTSVIIDDIEKGIQASDICLADITPDNPNIWYEVGYARANGKAVVLICAESRPTEFPFDVRHRTIVSYSLESASDFAKLHQDVTARLKALVEKAERLQTVESLSPVKDTEGLSSYEIAGLVAITENSLTPDAAVMPDNVKSDLERAGYTAMAISLSLKSLARKKMIAFDTESDAYGYSYQVCRITEGGVDWLIQHRDQFRMRREEAAQPAEPQVSDEDIPF
jgi:nucleoside 2-deoxyribosyltransferase